MSKTQLVNRQIRSPQVFLIDHENQNRGLMDTRDALTLAEDAGLDLVVVSNGKDAPVAKILDYGKLQYQQSKRQKQSSKPSLKEVKLRPNVGESDYQLRIRRSVEWLSKGDSVKFLVRLRGREHQHRDRAGELLDRIVKDIGDAGKVQALDKKALVLMITPA
ncbi:translation initiation factor IF-3 [Leptolyngbya sp. KIOST-1]|uniref:translation initiation factor IF-3 n=1 Tax=Leptolyngbya sp. KIOST-1 TaxID=1229172 RepID=UPI0009DFDFD4|nr:translation initiation factor IF-3 [Leptolyngbya sp. KIOST-1]